MATPTSRPAPKGPPRGKRKTEKRPNKPAPKRTAKPAPKRKAAASKSLPAKPAGKARPKPAAAPKNARKSGSEPADLSSVGRGRKAALERYAKTLEGLDPRGRLVKTLIRDADRMSKAGLRSGRWSINAQEACDQAAGYLLQAAKLLKSVSSDQVEAQHQRRVLAYATGDVVELKRGYQPKYAKALGTRHDMATLVVLEVDASGQKLTVGPQARLADADPPVAVVRRSQVRLVRRISAPAQASAPAPS